MQAGQAGTEAAVAIEQEIARLYEAEAPALLRYAETVAGNPETAQDALQEAFFRFFIARSAGQQFQSPKAWLFRVVRNFILDQKRSGARHEIGIESALNVASPAPDRAAGISGARLLPRLLEDAAQIGLSAREVDCFRLRSQGLRYDEIASVLGLRSGTVGALLARAHGKIRKALAYKEPACQERACEQVGKEGRGNRGFALAGAREKRYAS